MTGSHEVRGSIPLGSTNSINNLQPVYKVLNMVLCVSSASQSFGQALYAVCPNK